MSQAQTFTIEFERTQSVLYLPANYEAALREVTRPGQIALRGYIDWVADFERSGMSYIQFATQRAQQIGDTFSETSRRVARLMRSIPEVIGNLQDFGTSDRAIYSTLRMGYPNRPRLSRKIAQDQASSKIAYQVMHIGVDDLTYTRLRTDYPTHAGSSRKIAQDQASSKIAYQVMHIGVDDLTYTRLRWEYPTYPNSAHDIARDQASSDTAYHKMEEQLYRDQPGVGYQQSGGGDNSNQNQRHTQDSRSSAGSQSRPHAEGAQTKQATAYEELMATLRRGADRRMVRTIESFERAEVAKVIATVKHMREANPDITDKQIALKYNRLSNNSEKSTPERQRATQIVMVLMGGSVNGRLPF